ncbi:MAG: ABC transporter ATP-binding protein [Promethearchaeota archaeon]
MTKTIIETKNLSKYYFHKNNREIIKAIDNINISVKEGEIFGLIGPNGAGKTTLIHLLTTLKQPTKGTATIDGYDLIKNQKKVRNKISLMMGSSMLYYRITAYDNLKFFCKVYEVSDYEEKIEQMAKELELTKWLDEYVENFSSGMKMKLALCRTLLLERKILFLDEPTVGIDINTKLFIINKLKKINKTIFLTSHDMSIIEKLCEHVALINKGRILISGRKENLLSLIQDLIEIEINIKKGKKELIELLNRLSFIEKIVEKNGGILIRLQNRENYDALLKTLSNFKILKINEKDISLEQLFIKLNELDK